MYGVEPTESAILNGEKPGESVFSNLHCVLLSMISVASGGLLYCGSSILVDYSVSVDQHPNYFTTCFVFYLFSLLVQFCYFSDWP